MNEGAAFRKLVKQYLNKFSLDVEFAVTNFKITIWNDLKSRNKVRDPNLVFG